jgi:hypothetical protein
MPSRLPVMTRRNKVDRQETHGIRMVMNGETVEHQVHTWTGNGYIVKRSMLPVTDEIRARLLGPDVNGEHFMEITTMGTTVVVKATEESIRVLRATAKASAQDLGILPESIIGKASIHMETRELQRKTLESAQDFNILPESDSPPPLPTSGEVPRPEVPPVDTHSEAPVSPTHSPVIHP